MMWRWRRLETIVTLVTAMSVASASVPDTDDGQSVTVGASWLQPKRNDVVDEVVHSPEDYDDSPTTGSTTALSPTSTTHEQKPTETSEETSQTPSVGDNLDIFKLTEPSVVPSTTTTLTTNTTDSPIASVHTSPSSSPSTKPTDITTAPATNIGSAFRRDDSAGIDGVFTYRSTSNTSNDDSAPSTDTDEYYYPDDAKTEGEDVQHTDGIETNVDSAEDMEHQQEKTADEDKLSQELASDEAVLNVSESTEIVSSSFAAVVNDSVEEANQPQPPTSMSTASSTSTVSPMSTAWLLAELPSNSDWTSEVHSPNDDVASPREFPSSHAVVSAFSARFGPHWRLLRRQSRPTRRFSGYRQILASPFVAGGGAMSDRERKRALLHAYLLSGKAGKDLSQRRAMSAAVFYRSKLARSHTTQNEVDTQPPKTYTVQPSASSTVSPKTDDLVDVTTGWTEALGNVSSTWNRNRSTSFSADSWTSADNSTSNATSKERQFSTRGTQLHHTSADRQPASAAVVIPIIVGFLESLTKKQFSWLDLTLAVCGTVAAVLGLINLVVFVVHLLRNKRGKLSFHAERQLANGGHAPSDSPSSMSASRSSSDSTPPPPPPPPLPLAGFGALSRTTREVSRDALADDETLRIRPLTFKRPLTDWGFTSSHGTTDGAVVGPVAAVTVKSTGSDASSSGIESNGGRSGSDGSTRRDRENGGGGNMAVGSSSVITNYAYCGNGGVNKGIIIDVDEYRDHSCTSPSDFIFGKNYGELDTKRTTLTMMRPVTPTDDMVDRKQRQRRRKTQAKHRGRTTANIGRLDASLGGGLLSRPWKRLFGVSTNVSLPR